MENRGGGGVWCGVGYLFISNIFILYRVNHSVTLFIHGSLLQSKIHRYKEHIYTLIITNHT